MLRRIKAWVFLILDCFYLKIVLNMVSTIGFTTLNFEKDDHTLLIKANVHIEIAQASTAHAIFYIENLKYGRCKWLNRGGGE